MEFQNHSRTPVNIARTADSWGSLEQIKSIYFQLFMAWTQPRVFRIVSEIDTQRWFLLQINLKQDCVLFLCSSSEELAFTYRANMQIK